MQVDVKAPEWSIGREGARVSFLVPSMKYAQDICEAMEPGKEYQMSVERKKKKRSLSANALLWAVLGDMASALARTDPKVTPEYLYRRYIYESANYLTQEVWASEFPKLEQIWRSNGTGWVADIVDIAEDLGDDRKLTVRLYYGSSQYDTREFTKLVDSVLTDARELGIQHTSQAMRSLMEQYPGGQ